jgi:hypothetical protein
MPGFGALQLLSHVDNAGGASAQLITPVFDPWNFLAAFVRIAGYSANAVARLQFNLDTGTTAYSLSVMEGASAPTTQVSGTAAGIQLATTANVVRALIGPIWIRNVAGQVHGITWTGSSGSEAAATAPVIVQGSGVWANTARITRVTLDVGSGGGTLNAGTALDVYGVQ